jgi:hypothetical protein
VVDCEYLDVCPIFEKFKVAGAKNIWIEFFCRGSRRDECERRKLKKAGKAVPPTLLPNGTHLPTLK